MAVIALTLISLSSNIFNIPPQPEVQAEKRQQTTVEVSKKPIKKKVVKDVVKPKQPVRKPVEAPRVVKQNSVSSSGSCHDWIRSAGITDVESAYQLIMRESSCNPNSVNPSSGSCGLGQQLPCGKWAHQWNDPVGSLIDMDGYVKARYSTWANALAHSLANNWY